MKLNKKKVVVVSLAISLIAILSLGSLAWFNAKDEVTNKFMVTNSEDDAEKIFSVDVWEYVDGDTENKDQDGNEYNDIVPGGRYHKEPYVENTGLYDQWIRVKVTVSDADEWLAILGTDYDLTTIFEGFDASAWTRYDEPMLVEEAGESTLTYVYYLNYKLAPTETAALFNTVVIPSQLTQQDMATLGGTFELDIVAEALQADNTGNSAYEAFDFVGWEADENYGE